MSSLPICRQVFLLTRAFSVKSNSLSSMTPSSQPIKGHVKHLCRAHAQAYARFAFGSTATPDESKTKNVEPSIDELKSAVEELQAASDDWKAKHDDVMDKYRRSIAENDNMRKRLTKQIDDAKVFGIQGFAKDLLEVADVLAKAVATDDQSVDDLQSGLRMTQAQLGQVFKRHGLEPVDPLDEKFDPNLHEAIFQVPDTTRQPNTIVDVQKIGYTLNGRTIRPALVGVSKK